MVLKNQKNATIEQLHSDKRTYDVPVEVNGDRFDAMFNYCKHHWSDKKIAVIECDSILEDGTPVNGILVTFYEPVGSNKVKL